MNNTLPAKEWLDKKDLLWNYTAIPSIMLSKPELELLMEQYASYRTKELEEKVMGFRSYIKEHNILWWDLNIVDVLIDKFDKHFNTTSETK